MNTAIENRLRDASAESICPRVALRDRTYHLAGWCRCSYCLCDEMPVNPNPTLLMDLTSLQVKAGNDDCKFKQFRPHTYFLSEGNMQLIRWYNHGCLSSPNLLLLIDLKDLFLKCELLLCPCETVSHATLRPYQVSIVCRAGALLSDTHTETGQAAIFVFLAEVEGSRFTARARWAFNVHL